MTDTPRAAQFRAAIAGFIDARREAKLKGQDADADAGPAARYEYAAWLADAARRVAQIQAVTHVLKATHPDARGSSLYVAPSSLPPRAEIGSHQLGPDFATDVVGNAAALDVFKLLKLEVDGRPLLHWMQARDPDLQLALSPDADTASAWMRAFAALVRQDAAPATHPMAKQVYWLVGDDPQDDAHYHLLQPVFASALAHHVHVDIQTARFGEANTEARQAFRTGKPSQTTYVDYRGLVARKLGGTKPQNVSQLNSERGGVNYLLPSLPPAAWKESRTQRVSTRESAFEAFAFFGGVRELLRELTALLRSDPDPTADTRDRRDTILRALGEELAMFGAAVRVQYPPGWTRDPACRLPRAEALWLDPERTELAPRNDPARPDWAEDDLAFHREYHEGRWADEVAARFGRWLNDHLRKKGLVMLGEAEMKHWARQTVSDVAWPIPMQRRAAGDA